MHIWEIVISSGVCGLIGWVSIPLIVLLAVGVVTRVVVRPNSTAPELFFTIAEVQALLFLLTNGIMGICFTFSCVSMPEPSAVLEIWTLSVSQILLSLCINSTVVVFLVAVVAKLARRSRALALSSFLRAALLTIDFALLLVFISSIIVCTCER